MTVSTLSAARSHEIIGVFCDAFHDYPVMRYVLGPGDHFEERLRTLVGLFVNGRVFRNDPLLGVCDDRGTLAAAATMTLPGDPPPPAALIAHREAVWAELGRESRARYDTYLSATRRVATLAPHYHLNMLGVLRSHQGRGLSRPLLEAAHALSDSVAGSAGVSLSTEHPGNLSLYAHFGYRVLGQTRVSDSLETWSLFRPGLSFGGSSLS